jgi:hypothetical protein
MDSLSSKIKFKAFKGLIMQSVIVLFKLGKFISSNILNTLV